MIAGFILMGVAAGGFIAWWLYMIISSAYRPYKPPAQLREEYEKEPAGGSAPVDPNEEH